MKHRSRLWRRAFYVGVTRDGVGEVRLFGQGRTLASRRRAHHGPGRRWRLSAARELEAYFSGRLRAFSTPCDIRGLSPFARAVLRVTTRIPYGEVRSYRWLAGQLGKPKATRAVGNALARNPIPILIPCHRVVRSDGSLGGYALGLQWKRRLLELEKRHSAPRSRT